MPDHLTPQRHIVSIAERAGRAMSGNNNRFRDLVRGRETSNLECPSLIGPHSKKDTQQPDRPTSH